MRKHWRLFQRSKSIKMTEFNLSISTSLSVGTCLLWHVSPPSPHSLCLRLSLSYSPNNSSRDWLKNSTKKKKKKIQKVCKTIPLLHSLWRRANARNFSLVTFLRWKFEPYQPFWYQIFMLHIRYGHDTNISLETKPFIPLDVFDIFH